MEQTPIRKLYVNVATSKGVMNVVLKDNNGRTVEDYKEATKERRKNVRDYGAMVKALELCARHCRKKVYIFTDNRLLTNQFCGSMRIRNRELLARLMEIKLLCGFFEVVRVFHVSGEGKPSPLARGGE